MFPRFILPGLEGFGRPHSLRSGITLGTFILIFVCAFRGVGKLRKLFGLACLGKPLSSSDRVFVGFFIYKKRTSEVEARRF